MSSFTPPKGGIPKLGPGGYTEEDIEKIEEVFKERDKERKKQKKAKQEPPPEPEPKKKEPEPEKKTQPRSKETGQFIDAKGEVEQEEAKKAIQQIQSAIPESYEERQRARQEQVLEVYEARFQRTSTNIYQAH